MINRSIRFTDRLVRLVIRASIWLGDRIHSAYQSLAYGLLTRLNGLSGQMVQRVDLQVQSLTAVIIILLALVGGTLVFLATPDAQNSAIVGLFAPGSPQEANMSSGLNQADVSVALSQPLAIDTGTIIFSMYSGAVDEFGRLYGQQDLFALAPGQGAPVKLTNHPGDDREPRWSPDGTRIAFMSNRAGNWDLYILDLATGDTTRLTSNTGYDGAPTWSPDSQWLAYESYQNGNLDIYLIRADGEEGPFAVTRNPDPDYSPAWRPGELGRELAYASWRNGGTDVYIISLDNPNESVAQNVTNTPTVNEDNPAWDFTGQRLAYDARQNGLQQVFVKDVVDLSTPAVVLGNGEQPSWVPNTDALVFLTETQTSTLLTTGQLQAWEASIRTYSLDSYGNTPQWSLYPLPQSPRGQLALSLNDPALPVYEENLPTALEGSRLVKPITLQDVNTGAPFLTDHVDDSFYALRSTMLRTAGWDFLADLDSVWWPLDRLADPGQEFRNWHKAGRAFDIVQAYNTGATPQMEIVRVDQLDGVRWELYIRASAQDGSQGEPLTELPWDFSSRTSGSVQAYEQGGTYYDEIPSGYYVNFTDIAKVYGWHPVTAHQSWRSNWAGVLYWQYEKRDGLTWYAAMQQLYEDYELEAAFPSPTPVPVEPVNPAIFDEE